MSKLQTVTSKTKKALSASTPKARLTLIPTTNRNVAMNNSNAVNLNNQPRSEEQRQEAALLIVYKANQLSRSANCNAWAIQSIGKAINQNIVNGMSVDNETISGLLCAIDSLTNVIINESASLENLIDAGEYSDD